MAKILAQDPHKRLGGSRSPGSQLFVAASVEELDRLRTDRQDFEIRYRFAADRLQLTKDLPGLRNRRSRRGSDVTDTALLHAKVEA